MKLSLYVKKPSRHTSYRKRQLRLDSNDQVRTRRLKKLILFLMADVNRKEGEEKEVADMALKASIACYLRIVVCDDANQFERPLRTIFVRIGSLSDSDCKIEFSFNRAEMTRMLDLLRFPDEVTFDNRAVMYGEEVFLRGLYELVGGENKQKICKTFGREFSAQVRAFSWFMDYMFVNFHHLVHYV